MARGIWRMPRRSATARRGIISRDRIAGHRRILSPRIPGERNRSKRWSPALWSRVEARAMTRKAVVLVTGASGEMGHGLIMRLAEIGAYDILALDLRPVEPELSHRCAAVRVGDILDRHLLERIQSEFEISI